MLNNISIHGRLTADPELKYTQSQTAVCSFSVAVDRPYSKDEKLTDFFNVVCWRGLAEMVAKYFTKGKEIVLSGMMISEHWTDNNGTKRTTWKIQADKVDFCGSKSDADSAPAPAPTPAYTSPNIPDAYASTVPKQSDFERIADDDDLPF